MSPDLVKYQFAIPRDPGSYNDVYVKAWLGDAMVQFRFKDDGADGTEQMAKIMEACPRILQNVRDEVLVRKESADLDQELTALTSEDEV